MKSIFTILLVSLIPTLCLTQQTLDFDYFRRSGKVDVRYFLKNDQAKSNIEVQPEISLENISENQFLIIELSNLRLGLDKRTAKLKQEKDLDNYMLHVPIDPSSITLNTESLQFKSITNNGLLSDDSTTKANKKIEIYYSFYNASPNDISSDIQIKFKVEATEGAKPLKEDQKGGDIISCKVIIRPNELQHKRLEFSAAENKLFNDYMTAHETAYKIKFAREYISTYKSANEERYEEITKFLTDVQHYINPIDHDKKIFTQVVKFCVTELEKNRCQSLCAQYQDLVWDNPKDYQGTYLEQAYYHKIKLFSDSPNRDWLAWCEKFLQKFPSSTHASEIRSMKETHEQDIEKQKNKAQNSIVKFRPATDKKAVINTPEEPTDETTDIEEDILIPQKEDWATILIHDDQSGVIIRTGGLSSEGYVVEFRDISDQRIKFDPSFIGEKKSLQLDDVLEGKFKAGDYKISVFSKINRELLATNTIEYSSTKLPPELKYMMMVSCIALGFFSYKKYLKL